MLKRSHGLCCCRAEGNLGCCSIWIDSNVATAPASRLPALLFYHFLSPWFCLGFCRYGLTAYIWFTTTSAVEDGKIARSKSATQSPQPGGRSSYHPSHTASMLCCTPVSLNLAVRNPSTSLGRQMCTGNISNVQNNCMLCCKILLPLTACEYQSSLQHPVGRTHTRHIWPPKSCLFD